MNVKFSEDVLPISDLKVSPGRIIRRISDSKRPLLLTCRGRGVAIVQSLPDFEERQEEQSFMRAVVQGLMDLEAGREVAISEVKRRLRLE